MIGKIIKANTSITVLSKDDYIFGQRISFFIPKDSIGIILKDYPPDYEIDDENFGYVFVYWFKPNKKVLHDKWLLNVKNMELLL